MSCFCYLSKIIAEGVLLINAGIFCVLIRRLLVFATRGSIGLDHKRYLQLCDDSTFRGHKGSPHQKVDYMVVRRNVI